MDAYNDIFGTTAKALDLRAKRMEKISANIANADVAGYKSKDIDFKKMMSKEMSGMLTNTHNKHIGACLKKYELHLPRTNQPVRERQYGRDELRTGAVWS